jgi:hypothetical protein
MLFFAAIAAVLALAARHTLGDTGLPLRSRHGGWDGGWDGGREDGRHGAVSSESAFCSSVGIELIKAGGNAADAVSLFIHTR